MDRTYIQYGGLLPSLAMPNTGDYTFGHLSVSPRMKKGQVEASSKGTISAQNFSEKGTFINANYLKKEHIRSFFWAGFRNLTEGWWGHRLGDMGVQYPLIWRSGSGGPPPEDFFVKKNKKWCILRAF